MVLVVNERERLFKSHSILAVSLLRYLTEFNNVLTWDDNE